MATAQARFTASLPPVKCTPEMAEAVKAAAAESGLSMADIIRAAIARHETLGWGERA
jgi:hypothetical protein